MRFIDDRFPIAAPLEAEIRAESADDFVKGRFEYGRLRFLRVAASGENCDIDGDAEIVVGKASARIGDFLTGLGAPLSKEGVLFRKTARGAGDLDDDALRHRFLDERAHKRPDPRMQGGDILLAARIRALSFATRPECGLLTSSSRLAADACGAPVAAGTAVHKDASFFARPGLRRGRHRRRLSAVTAS